MKRYLSILLIIVSVFMLTACSTNNDGKKFSEDDFEITLNDNFQKKDIVGVTYYYQNDNMNAAVVVKKESKDAFENAGIIFPDDVKSYAEFIVKNNFLTDSKVTMDGKVAKFDYHKTVNGTKYYYYAVAQRNNDDYWLVTFYCLSEKANEYKTQFDKWADTIVVK